MAFEKAIFWLALVWYLITAWFSMGYIHLDEHYQIIEFAGYLQGWNSESELAWEFNAQIRSSIQPTLCFLIFEFCEFIGVTSPFVQAFVLRAITGVLFVIIINLFIKSCRKIVAKKYWKGFVILSYFLWFLPFINVRFSSETWSGMFLLLSLSMLLQEKISPRKYFAIGVILGIGFLFRFQLAIAGLAIVLWLIFVKKESVLKIGYLLAGGIVVVVLGVLLDRWFYGNWTLAFWNYFREGIVEGLDSEFGISPWYYYVKRIVLTAYFPFGVLIFSSLLVLFFKRRENLLVFVAFIFFLVHCLIPHKELRFIFPIINLVPIILVMGYQEMNNIITSVWSKKIIIIALSILLIINCVGLIVASTTSPGGGRALAMKEIRKIAPLDQLSIYYVNECNPYSPWGYKAKFYARKKLKIKKLNSDMSKEIKPINDSKKTVLVINSLDLDNKWIQDVIEKFNLKRRTKPISKFSSFAFKVFNQHDKNFLIVYSN